MNIDRPSTNESTLLRKRKYDEMTPPLSMGGRPHPEYGFPMASPEVLEKRRKLQTSRPTLSSMQSPRDDNSSGVSFTPLLFQPFVFQPFVFQPPPTQQSSTQLSLMPTTTSPSFDFSSLDLKKSVNETGLWQMGGERLKSLKKQLPTFVKSKTPKSTDIRIKAITQSTENWGISADENVRTEFQRNKRFKMGDDEAETVFNQRSHQATLIWKTDSPSLSQYGDKTDSSQPLSGHTPGIKTQDVGGTKGALTKEHGTRDPRREKILSKTIDDPNRGEHDLSIMSKLATIQLFMSPKEELETVKSKVGKSKTPIYSQFKDIGDISGSNTGNFDKLVNRVQTVRETDKMFTAKNLLISGYDTLVPETHKELLVKAKGDVGEAMRLLHEESSDPQSKVKFNTSTHSQVPRLDLKSLREMSKDKNLTQRPLSPVRRIEEHDFKF
jgi:hypothetical protein